MLKINFLLNVQFSPSPPFQVFVNGMFAFVLYDSGRDEYFVARDPVSLWIIIFVVIVLISIITTNRYILIYAQMTID